MCPWPRIQAALTDEYALNVTYRYDRGEPRCSVKKAEQLRAHGEPAGDCVDCLQCVHVCPTGVDIRDGANLGCIQCGLCIDACDDVMAKLGRATGLIAYDTDLNIKRRDRGQARRSSRSCACARSLYAAVIAVVGGIMIYHARHPRQRRHQRHPRPQPDVCAAVRRRAAQRLHHPHRQQAAQRRATSSLSVDGLPSTLIDFVGLPPRADGRPVGRGRPRPDPRKCASWSPTTARRRRRRRPPILFTADRHRLGAQSPKCATISSGP